MSSSYLFTERSDLDDAVAAWIADETNATDTYGDINTWNVSGIENFIDLFANETLFNNEIKKKIEIILILIINNYWVSISSQSSSFMVSVVSSELRIFLFLS